jgi:HAD superfamily hydrolase (TIGR01490 family)
MNLALFDFDGTVTTRDSFLLFLRHAAGETGFLRGALTLAPAIIRFKLGRYPNYRLKEDFLRHFFQGWERERFIDTARDFTVATIPTILRPGAVQQIREHLDRGDRVSLVSASPELVLSSWCSDMGIELLATRLETEQGVLTGSIQGRNCWGPEKVRRIEEKYTLSDFDTIYAYGDSRGDREMLAMAHRPHYRFF